ncbi:DUF3134 family protein [Lyngbya confervoides]|uniref:DUF3134 domain-containing protein n=1 Tax=Lyngbya confervoides BDU141951 TaxID=1574623 RepID=A0ABD4SZD9_9CYAN|nr:DUF3134 family protein [Lyngbya confervoides]MCM1981796.1 DUF3134 domain-containing protein [Lyngbya confervoides BDU141951]
MQNPSLRQQALSELAPVIPPNTKASILTWLEGTGRLMDREVVEPKNTEEEEIEEINALMGDSDDYIDEDDDA